MRLHVYNIFAIPALCQRDAPQWVGMERHMDHEISAGDKSILMLPAHIAPISFSLSRNHAVRQCAFGKNLKMRASGH